MKIFNPLSIILILVLAITMVSCTTTQYASDESYERERYERERQLGNRIYIDDPYRGTVVLERDPYTGRYYDVTAGYGYNNRYSAYGYNPYRNNNVYYRPVDRSNTTTRPQQTTDDRNSKAREEARRKVLGN